MAKALLGYLPGPDSRSAQQVWALQRRVADLEAEVARLNIALDRAAASAASASPDLDDELRELGGAHAASAL